MGGTNLRVLPAENTTSIYLISTTGFDYADLGRQFRRLFPAVLFLDLAWAVSPVLLIHKIGGLSLVCIAGLVYLPFSQRNLLFAAYAPGGGRSSGAKVPGAL